MESERHRTSTEITSKAGGIFWGIVLLIIGTIWLLASLGVVRADLNIVWPLVILLAGIYLILIKTMR